MALSYFFVQRHTVGSPRPPFTSRDTTTISSFNSLTHLRSAVSAAYNHALYLEPRAKMMQDWADFLSGRSAV